MQHIQFYATQVAGITNIFSEDFCVFNLCFDESDNETGQSWQFQRALGEDGTLASLGEEDEGICVVQEPQLQTFYEGITSLEISRSQLRCRFDSATAEQIGIQSLHIRYQLEDAQWQELVQIAKHVIVQCNYANIIE
ncbi:Imm10 family immunity protein [Celerinatantimonas sp. MCCC 1A17872]|uniref:Imm10 family immunity protein n=1 Tax=Celerinatantimonas sp. MCCC 1A17872 TaxID=3177514 RepID=UPI0038BF4304